MSRKRQLFANQKPFIRTNQIKSFAALGGDSFRLVAVSLPDSTQSIEVLQTSNQRTKTTTSH